MTRSTLCLVLCALVAPATALATSPFSVGVGDTIEGELTGDDPTHPMRPAHMDGVKLPLTAGEAVTITLTSDAIDTYLYVVAPDGALVAEDDDSAGDLNSQVSFVAAADGLYTLQITSYGAETGAWTLSVAPWIVQPWVFAELEVGETLQGTLDDSDPTYGDRLGDGLAFALDAGASVRLHVASDAFDARVEVLGPDGESLAFDDDGGGGTNAAVVVTAPVAGAYRAVVTGWQRGATGAWTATLSPAGARAAGRDLSAAVNQASPTPLAVGERLAGELDASDPTHPERGAPMDVFAFTIDRAGGYDVAMRSNVVDGWLQVLDADGRLIAESDDADGTHPVVQAVFEPGTYTAVATAWGPQTGAYAVTLLDTSARRAAPTSLVAGQRTDGEITAAGPVSPHNGHSAVRYRLDVAAGEIWQVTAASQQLDTYLVVRDEAGVELLYDDDGGGGTNSRARIAMPVDASLIVEVTTYDGETGPFVVAATQVSR